MTRFDPVLPAAAALFSAGSTTALLSWGALAATLFVPRLRRWTWRATGLLVPALLAVG